MITPRGVPVAVCFSSATQITTTIAGDCWGLCLHRGFSSRDKSLGLGGVLVLRLFIIIIIILQ